MKYLLTFSRLFVGSLFIVSGLIKANDPLGFSYKLEEYFAESALNLPFLEPWALALAILVCVGEIVLGFAVLFGAKIRLASWSLLLLTLFFGWLTAYTATCDPQATYETIINGETVQKSVTCVTDCGCFGDAMKGSVGRSLTPWESFAKDMVLLVFILPIFFMQGKIKTNKLEEDKYMLPLTIGFVVFFSWVFGWYFPVGFTLAGYLGFLGFKKVFSESEEKADWPTAVWAVLLAFGFAWYTYSNLPVKDYRPYAIGKSIVEGMKTAEELGLEPPQYGYIYTLVHTASGEEKEITDKVYIADKWWENKEWEMNSEKTKQVKLKDGYEAPIHDFFISDEDGNDRTQEILSYPAAYFVIAYDLGKTSHAEQQKLVEIASQCESKGIPFIGLTASGYTQINNLRHEHQIMYPYWNGDATMLKTIVRSNPGLIYLENGVVKNKWHFNNLSNVTID